MTTTEKERLIEALTSKTGLTMSECSSKFQQAVTIIDSMGIPYFMVASGIDKDEEGEPSQMGNMMRCQGAYLAVRESLLAAAISSDVYMDLFIEIGHALNVAREGGMVEAIRTARKPVII